MNSLTIHSQVTDATVYLQGAQVTHKGTVRLKKGRNRILYGDLPHTLLEESLQAFAPAFATILLVEHRIDYLQEMPRPEDVAALSERLEEMTLRRRQMKNTLDLCAEETGLFEANRKLGGAENGLKADELRQAVEYYHQKMQEIKTLRTNTEFDLAKLEREIETIEQQLNKQGGQASHPVSRVAVEVNAEKATEAELTLCYYLPEASWVPMYDVRAFGIGKDVQITLKARVEQTTGENWEKTHLTLSTGQPTAAGHLPIPMRWALDFDTPLYTSQMRTASAKFVDVLAAEECLSAPVAAAASADMQQGLVSVDYEIREPAGIESGGEQIVDVITHTLPASYRYYCVPRMDKEVYLQAIVEGWEELNLITGEASIFYKNRFIGRSMIDPHRITDEFELSLGTDKAVVVTRVRGKNHTEKTLTGSGVRSTRQWDITVRNLKPHDIHIRLLDQVPVSENRQIQVETPELSGAQLNPDTGILTWDLHLEPAELLFKKVKYLVTYPKNTVVPLE